MELSCEMIWHLQTCFPLENMDYFTFIAFEPGKHYVPKSFAAIYAYLYVMTYLNNTSTKKTITLLLLNQQNAL